MALAVLAVDDHGHSSGKTKNCKVPFSQVLYQVWKSMAEDGVITLVRDLTPTETKQLYAAAVTSVNLVDNIYASFTSRLLMAA